MVQQGTGLRPSELLALKPGHIYIPSDVSSAMTLRLGATVSTKVKREQFVLILFSKQPLVYELVRHLCNTTVSSERLFPFSYSFYNNSFKTAEEHYGLCIGTTAHSPRSGCATTAILAGESVKSVQSRGRWLCESSFQTYVDVAAASHIRSQVVTKRLAVTADWISTFASVLSVANQPWPMLQTFDSKSTETWFRTLRITTLLTREGSFVWRSGPSCRGHRINRHQYHRSQGQGQGARHSSQAGGAQTIHF